MTSKYIEFELYANRPVGPQEGNSPRGPVDPTQLISDVLPYIAMILGAILVTFLFGFNGVHQLNQLISTIAK